MTQEDKQLLLKDLCARMPYQPMCEFTDTEDDFCTATATLGYSLRDFIAGKTLIKPYLRPMSSMTSKEWVEFCDCSLKDEASWVLTENRQRLIPTQNRDDYLNSKHFDYRGLIPMGLALEAPENMYNMYKND